ncbi:MAG: SulP family inorganic anion transporter [Oceanococcaceae bacterium]
MRLQLPLLRSLQDLPPGAWKADLLAGLITGALLLPQALAYAQLAGLPPQSGLIASILPPLIYALFGGSRTLSVGPVAVAALMVMHALAPFAEGDPSRWLGGAMILAAEGGVFLLLLRALRLGGLVAFVSHPVLYGFTAGAALLIILSQLPHLSGAPLEAEHPWEVLLALPQMASQAQPGALAFGLGAVALLLLARGPLIQLLRATALSPAAAVGLSRLVPLFLLVAAILLVRQLEPTGLRLVGPLPSGLPLPDWSLFRVQGWLELAPSAALIALVGYVESMAVARVLAQKRRQKLNPNTELTALGLANLGAALSAAMPVAGGFSRSVVNFEAGALSQRATLVSVACVALVAAFLSAPFAYLPQAVLAAIIVVAVAQLIDWKAARAILAYDRGDGLSLGVTLLGVLVFGIEQGLMLGMVLSIALYLRRTSSPHIAVVGRVAGTEHFRNVERHAVECTPGVLTVRVDESLYFANIDEVESRIEALLNAQAVPPQALLLILSAVSSIDASAEEALLHWEEALQARGIQLHLAEVKGPVWDRLARSAFGQRVQDRVHLSAHQALQALALSVSPRDRSHSP